VFELRAIKPVKGNPFGAIGPIRLPRTLIDQISFGFIIQDEHKNTP
jgi:hypothetical protein